MKKLALFLKGMAMGAADVVPGVSGGTIAFISGIYDELIDSIKSIDLKALQILKNKGLGAAWNHINGNFLLTLFSGVLLSIVTFANIISYLLITIPIYVWSFFFGLLIASSLLMLNDVKRWNLALILLMMIGISIGAGISLLPQTELGSSTFTIFLAGSIAICAMILPGISGSFLLLLMGLYTTIITAIKTTDIEILSLFAGGAICGLLAFSRLLSWLLHHYHQPMFVFLTGLMIGALVKVWPWKETLSYRTNSRGEQVPFIEHNILPNLDSGILLALLAGGIGFTLVWAFNRFSIRSSI